MQEFLDSPVPSDQDDRVLTGDPLARFAGSYSFADRGQERNCDVTVEDGTLVASGPSSGWRHTRLLAEAGARSSAKGSPYEFTIVEDAAGIVRQMRAGGPELLWECFPRVYRRQTVARDAVPMRPWETGIW